MPGEEVVIWLQLRAALDSGRVWPMFRELLHGLHVALYHLTVQVVQAPVVCGEGVGTDVSEGGKWGCWA